MPLYKKSKNKLDKIKEEKIKLEKNIQNLVEENLNKVFNFKFISTEFCVANFRIDTLAFNEETKSFIIIEYKRDKSFSVIDQGYAYLATMLNNKADFILEYNEKCEKDLKRGDVDWSQSRIIFVANSFTKHQKEAIGFKDLPMELWECKKYDGGLFLISKVESAKKSESIKTISKDNNVKRVSKEVKEYSVDDHFKDNWQRTRVLFEEFSERALELDSRLEIDPVKTYIGFKIDNSVAFEVVTRKSKLVLKLYRVKPKDLKDLEGRTRYQENSYDYFSKHITVFDIKSEDDIDYAVMLIKQILNDIF